jgi:hypothetical protein
VARLAARRAISSRPWWKCTVTRSVETLRNRSSGGKEAARAAAGPARRRKAVTSSQPARRPMNGRGYHSRHDALPPRAPPSLDRDRGRRAGAAPCRARSLPPRPAKYPRPSTPCAPCWTASHPSPWTSTAPALRAPRSSCAPKASTPWFSRRAPASSTSRGAEWGLSERFFGAVVTREGDPAWVTPAFEKARALEQIQIGTDVRAWEEHESPSASWPPSCATGRPPRASGSKRRCRSPSQTRSAPPCRQRAWSVRRPSPPAAASSRTRTSWP